MEAIVLIQNAEEMKNGHIIQDSFLLNKWIDDDHIVVTILDDCDDSCDSDETEDGDNESSIESSTTINQTVRTENNCTLKDTSIQTDKGIINTRLCKFYNDVVGCSNNKCRFTHLKSKTPNWNDIAYIDNIDTNNC